MGKTCWILCVLCTLRAADLNQAASAAKLNASAAALAAENRYAEAETRYQAALRECESCPQRASILNNLGALYYSTKAYKKAEPLLERALEIWPVDQDADSPLHNLAAVYRAQGRLTEAAPLYERALQIHEARVHTDDLTLMPMLVGLALLQHQLGNYERVEALILRAQSAASQHQSESSSSTGLRFLELGQLLDTTGNPGGARIWLQRALEIRTRLFGAGSAAAAHVLIELGQNAELSRNLHEAEQMFRAALRIYEANHLTNSLLDARLRLAWNLGRQKKFSEAEKLFRQVLAQTEPENPDAAMAATGLARALSSRHRYDEARAVFARVLAMDDRNFGPRSLNAAYDLSNAADVEALQKRYPAAEEMLDRSLSILRERLPANHLAVGKTLAKMADVNRMHGQRERAASLYRDALMILEPVWGKSDPRLVPVLEDYVAVLRAQQDYATAAAVDAQNMKIRVTNTLRNSKRRIAEPTP